MATPGIPTTHLWRHATPHNAKENAVPSISVPYVVITLTIMGLSRGMLVAFDSMVGYCSRLCPRTVQCSSNAFIARCTMRTKAHKGRHAKQTRL